jgi:8-oxo-dGTP pyrophosphatase MutT (NUDIX family)
VIPLRRASGHGVQLCLIRRKDSSKWGIPKGFIDTGDTPEQAALKEAYEEAGLSGSVIGESIGTYEYKKMGIRLTVAVFLMQVLEEQPTWQEMAFRERRWLPLDQASTLLEDHRVSPLLDRLKPQSILKSFTRNS